MKYIYLLTVLALAAAYDTKYDGEDIDAVVNDKKALLAFVECFLDKGPCTEVTAHFKKDLGHAIEHKCDKCNTRQMDMIKIFLTHLEAKDPENFVEFQLKYDPKGDNIATLMHKTG